MKLELIKGDITTLETDAIVNAANTSLLGGGGVDGAIHRAGGPKILEECKEIRNRQGGCEVGEAVFTTAGKLKAKYVIHTVGPIWKDGNTNEHTLLANCYVHSLNIAEKLHLQSIAFPNISTGIYRFPKDQAVEVALTAVKSHHSKSVQKVIFVCFDDENFDLYKKQLEK